MNKLALILFLIPLSGFCKDLNTQVLESLHKLYSDNCERFYKDPKSYKICKLIVSKKILDNIYVEDNNEK